MTKKQKISLFALIILSGTVLLIGTIAVISTDPVSGSSKVGAYSSVFLSILTFIYVLLTYFILDTTNKSTQELIRPYIIVTFPSINHILLFSIKNIGKRPAYNIDISISPPISSLQMDTFKGNCEILQNQKFLAPEQEIQNMVTPVPHLLQMKKNNQMNLNIIISYSDSSGHFYKEIQDIDLSNYIYPEKIVFKEVKDHLEDIAKYIKEIANR